MILIVNSHLRVARAMNLSDALQRGYVDIRSGEAFPAENEPLFAALAYLRPGVVNNLAYNWNGVTLEEIQQSGRYLKAAMRFLPDGLFVASTFETVRNGYRADLKCKVGPTYFDFETLRGLAIDDARAWIDISRPATLDFFSCLGEIYIDQGFRILNIQQGDGLVEHALVKDAAKANLTLLQSRLNKYALERGIDLYWQGEPGMLDYMHLDLVMVPARFYIDDFDRKYRNRVDRRGVGVGYSYSLSVLRVQDINASIAGRATAIFAVDNFDEKQDDLRRFMELDADNRRYLIVSSAQTAHDNGSVFAIPLDLCPGCINISYVRDQCMILPNGSSEYNAVRCLDLQVINEALKIKGSGRANGLRD